MPGTLETPVAAELHTKLSDVFQSMVEHASARLVYGEPVSAGGKTILPVATIRYGFGGGSGAKEDGQQRGGGGGGGLIAKPLGVVEVTESISRFIPITSNGSIVLAVGIGVALGLLLARKRVDVRVEKRGRD
jgi:uncharacterized spore protein YtfJ